MRKIEIIEIWTCQGGNCFYCHRPMTWTRQSYATSWTKDHFYPKVNGNGLNGNTVLCHEKCNHDKKARLPNKTEKEQFKKLYLKIEDRFQKLKKMKDVYQIKKASVIAYKKPQKESRVCDFGKW